MLRQWTKPDNRSLPVNAALDLDRTRLELILENALLRQQIIILEQQSKRPRLSWRDRTIIVLLVSKLRTWKEALKIVQPDTVLRWHRDLFRWVWTRKSRPRGPRSRRPRYRFFAISPSFLPERERQRVSHRSPPADQAAERGGSDPLPPKAHVRPGGTPRSAGTTPVPPGVPLGLESNERPPTRIAGREREAPGLLNRGGHEATPV
jgi:hypothetical protein